MYYVNETRRPCSADSLSESDPESPGRAPTPRSSIAAKHTGQAVPSKVLPFLAPKQQSTTTTTTTTTVEGREREREGRAAGDETESEDEGDVGDVVGGGDLMSPRSQREGPPPPPLPHGDADDDGDSTASEEESSDEDY